MGRCGNFLRERTQPPCCVPRPDAALLLKAIRLHLGVFAGAKLQPNLRLWLRRNAVPVHLLGVGDRRRTGQSHRLKWGPALWAFSVQDVGGIPHRMWPEALALFTESSDRDMAEIVAGQNIKVYGERRVYGNIGLPPCFVEGFFVSFRTPHVLLRKLRSSGDWWSFQLASRSRSLSCSFDCWEREENKL